MELLRFLYRIVGTLLDVTVLFLRLVEFGLEWISEFARY